MHASKSTSTTAHAWDYYPANTPQALYRLLIQEAISQKFGDNAITNEDAYNTHSDILDFALNAALALLGVGTSWQPVVSALLTGQPIAVDIGPLIRSCSPVDNWGLE